MECHVTSRDGSGDVRDEFGIQDGINAFITPTHTILSQATNGSGGERTLVGSEGGDPNTSTSPEGAAWPQGKEKDPNEVGFDGPDDPEDPFNMRVWRKWVIVISIATASTCVTCASSMAASTYAGLQRSYHISEEVAILTVSMFVLGLGVGPLVLGPTSEFVGRRMVYLWSYLSFLLFTIPVALSNNAPVHMIFRFVTGFAGSAFLAVAGGTVADLFETHKLGTPMTVYSTTPFLGPVLGPVISGFINYNVDWRWTYYVLLIWSGVELFVIYFLVPETFRPQLLRRKAKRLRKATGNQEIYAPIERSGRSFLNTLILSSKTPFFVVAPQLMADLLTLWVALILAVLYIFFDGFPSIFMELHGLWVSITSVTFLLAHVNMTISSSNQQQAGLTFLGIGVGQVIAALSTPIWSRLYKREAAKHGGRAPPEARLLMGMAGAIATPVGLWIFALTTFKNVHWIWPIIGSIPFGMGTIWTFNSVFTYLVDAYRPVAASAMAFNSFVRCSFAAGFPLFGRQMYHTLGNVGASCLLAGLVSLMVPLPFVFYRIGEKIRNNSNLGSS